MKTGNKENEFKILFKNTMLLINQMKIDTLMKIILKTGS